MIDTTNLLSRAAVALNKYLLKSHWNGAALVGPDSGVRWNYRLGRFVKSYLSFFPWQDHYIFMQTQAYWILANWKWFELTGNTEFQQRALAGSQYLVGEQQPEGYWRYPPLPSRVGKIATVEGNFATIALLATHRWTQNSTWLAAAMRWHEYLSTEIGFQEKDGVMAVNYWANGQGLSVPNNTTLTLWTLAELALATGDFSYLAGREKMLSFLQRVQLQSGELPYGVGVDGGADRPHFLCYQYNAFEFLDLYHYLRCTGDESVLPLMGRLAQFLATGVTASGAARYNCQQEKPETVYYTTAVATALAQATRIGLGDYRPLVERAYNRVLALQRLDGGLAFFSQGNYSLFSDRRSYPRNLSMILYHLLLELQSQKASAE